MIGYMNKFQPHIIPVYPPHNEIIFEEWFALNYKGCNTDRVLLPFYPTSYWVNNDYANDLVAKKEVQDYIDSLPNDIKYFVICQYDDGCLIDWGSKDVLEFNMSKTNGVMIPLICMPHPTDDISGSNSRFAFSFIGSRTHPVRDVILAQNKNSPTEIDLYYMCKSEPTPISSYCWVLKNSVFGLCPRGYGASSFRIAECLQFGAIPVYISDEFIFPFGLDFNDFGVVVKNEDAANVHKILSEISTEDINKKRINGKQVYEDCYTYEGCFNEIIKFLETEYHSWQEKAAITEAT